MNADERTFRLKLALTGIMAFAAAAGGGEASAQTSMPTTSPATTLPTSRPRLVIPPGFQRVDAGTRLFLIEEKDQAWVRPLAERLAASVAKGEKSATRPSTMASDVLTLIRDRKPGIISGMAADLGIEEARVGKWLDEVLIKELERFESIPTRTVLLVTTKKRLIEIMAAGWETPVLHFNRANSQIYPGRMTLGAADADDAQALMPMVYDETLEDNAREEQLAGRILDVDAGVMQLRSQAATYALQGLIVSFIGNEGLGDIKAGRGQDWLLLGATGMVTAKYMSIMTGYPRQMIVNAMMADVRGGVNARGVDLMEPIAPELMRREALLPYADAMRRKSVHVVDELELRAGGDEGLAKVIKAVRQKKAAGGLTDAKGLVDLVKEVTGIDVEPMLRPG